MIRTATFALSLVLCIAGVAQAQSAANHCKVKPTRADALDFPSRHAWHLFISLNHPAVDEAIERGRPDCTRPIGAPGSTVLWETWRNAETEVYLAGGSEPPEWNDNTLPDAAPGSVPEMIVAGANRETMETAERQALLSFHDLGSRVVRPEFSPGDGVFTGSGGFGETRMNRATYEFVKRNCLWSQEGLMRYAQAVVDGKKPPITFPVDSIEVKAAWLDFEEQGIPADRQNRYYTAEFSGKKYGLTSLHILTKDIPNWFWATFHHVDAPDNPFETHDDFGRPRLLDGTVWENYLLGGTQVDFVMPTGRPTILSDHYVEFGFQRSSCITCHATATISPDGSAGPDQAMALCLLSPDIIGEPCKQMIGEHLFKPGTLELWHERGAPFAEWFERNGSPFHFQTDFVWSIPFRAANEASPPPARCVW